MRRGARLALVPALVLLAWWVWEAAPAVLALLGLGLLDSAGRVALVVLALSLADALLSRLLPPAQDAGHG